MMIAEHRRPFAAFLLLLAFACAVMANGLRDQVVRVFVESGAPRPLISAVVPDILLGRSLRDAPQAEPAGEEADESTRAVSGDEPSSSESATTERVVTLVGSTSAAVRPTSAGNTGGDAGDGSAADPGPSGTPTAPTPPSVVPVVPVDPAPVPRPPLKPATPGIGVDVPGTDGEAVRGQGNKPRKGFGSDRDGDGRSWHSDKKRGHDTDRGHTSWGKGDERDHRGLGTGGDRSDGGTGDRNPGWRSGDRERGESSSHGWRSDGRDRGGHDVRGDRGRHGDRERGHSARGRGHADRGGDHASHSHRGKGHHSRGGGHGRGHR